MEYGYSVEPVRPLDQGSVIHLMRETDSDPEILCSEYARQYYVHNINFFSYRYLLIFMGVLRSFFGHPILEFCLNSGTDDELWSVTDMNATCSLPLCRGMCLLKHPLTSSLANSPATGSMVTLTWCPLLDDVTAWPCSHPPRQKQKRPPQWHMKFCGLRPRLPFVLLSDAFSIYRQMVGCRWNGKALQVSDRGWIELQSWNLPGAPLENLRKTSFRISGVPVEIQTKHVLSTSLQRFFFIF